MKNQNGCAVQFEGSYRAVIEQLRWFLSGKEQRDGDETLFHVTPP